MRSARRWWDSPIRRRRWFSTRRFRFSYIAERTSWKITSHVRSELSAFTSTDQPQVVWRKRSSWIQLNFPWISLSMIWKWVKISSLDEYTTDEKEALKRIASKFSHSQHSSKSPRSFPKFIGIDNLFAFPSQSAFSHRLAIGLNTHAFSASGRSMENI